MPSSVAAAEAAASARSTAPRRPLVVDWQLQHSSQGGMLVCGYVYECTGFKMLPPAMLSGGVLLTSDGKDYDLLHPCYDLRTGTIATSPGCATDSVAPPMLRSPRRGRRNVPASNSDNQKMAATVDGLVAHSCSRCTHVDQAGPCSFAPAAAACCAAAAAAAAATSGHICAAACTSGIDTGCEFHDDKHIARLCATGICPSQLGLSSTPSTVRCESLQRSPPVARPSATTAAVASEPPSPLLRPPTPFDDVDPTDLHVVVEAGARRDVCGATAPSQRHLNVLTTAICPPSSLPTVGASYGRASAEYRPAGSRLCARCADFAMTTAASSVAAMPVTENMQTARLRDCQSLSCKGRAAQYDRDPVAVTSFASDQSRNSPAVAPNGCKTALSVLANWGVNAAAGRRITEPTQDEATLADSSPHSNVSEALPPYVASLWPPPPRCAGLPRSIALLSSTAAQATAVRATVYPSRAPAASPTSTTAAARTTAAPHRTEWFSSSGVAATSALTIAGTSGRILRSSNRHSDSSNRRSDTSPSDRTLRSTARGFDLSCTSTLTSANASERPSFDPTFKWSSFRDGGSSTASSSARKRKRAGRESAGNDHPLHSAKQPRLAVTEAAPEPSKGGYHSRKGHRSNRVQVSSRVDTCQSDAVLSAPTRTAGSCRTERALASSREHSGCRKVDSRERDARSSTYSNDVARFVSSRHSREHDGNRGSRKVAFSRSKSPSPPPKERDRADRLRSATHGSGGRAGHQQGTALGSYEVPTHVKDRCRASGDRRRFGDVPSAADSDAVRGPLRSETAAADIGARGVCLPTGHSGLASCGSSSRSVTRSDGRPLCAKRPLEPPQATVPSASSSRKTREQPLRAAAASRAANKTSYVNNDPLRGRGPAVRTR